VFCEGFFLLCSFLFFSRFFFFFSFPFLVSILLDGVLPGFSGMPYYCQVGGIRQAGKYHKYHYYFDIAPSTAAFV